MKYKINWAWLKNTVPGMKGRIPNLGLSYKHIPKSRFSSEFIMVLDGSKVLVIIQDSNLKSGWTKVYQWPKGEFYKND